jgi:hypothetical protein
MPILMLQKSTLSSTSNAPQTSKEQKQFHKLLERIEVLKKMIEEQKQLASKFSQLKNEQVLPLMNRLRDVKLSQVHALDRAFNRITVAKRLKTRLVHEIIDRINELLTSFHFDAEQEEKIMSIFARHSGMSVENLKEEQKEQEEDAARDYLWEYYGITLEDGESADLNDPIVVEKIRAKIAEEAEFQEYYSKQKTTKSDVNSGKAKALQDKLSKSIRSVYTSLVKHLHPDKEMDEEKKISKTEAIKEVTLAYETKDMLTLLILQAKYGIVEESINDSDLRSYNTILKKQATDLENQHLEIVNNAPGIPMHNEKSLEQFFKSEKNYLKKHIKQEQSILQGVFENEDMLIEYLKQGYY